MTFGEFNNTNGKRFLQEKRSASAEVFFDVGASVKFHLRNISAI